MKRLLLELGGKGAAVVCDDADLDLAITTISSVWTFHSGQICTAPTRAVVHRSRYQELVDRLAAMAGALPVGDPTAETTIVGPLISGAQRDRVEAHIAAGADEGAELVVDGRGPDVERGFYVAPTLLAGCTSEMRPVQEEIFGPVIVVIPVDDDDEAIAVANSTDYGLYDYVITGDSERAFALAKRLRSGNVGINTAQRNMEAPFGGFKLSGVGRDGGDFGLLAYTEMQTIVWPG
jgi:acyl-CoA reductase-like NAD-dependent aldehyde dehydrogenase